MFQYFSFPYNFLLQIFFFLCRNFISKLDAIKKEKENTQETILKLEKNHDIEHNQCNDVNVNKIKKQMKNRLLPLHNQTTELLK